MSATRPPGNHDNKDFRPIEPNTPPHPALHFISIPPTPKKIHPRKITKISSSEPLFQNELPSLKQKTFQKINIKCSSYSTLRGQNFPLIKQPTQSKSCGASALLMLALGSFEKRDPQTAADLAEQYTSEKAVDFWKWHATCQLTQPDEIQQVLNNHFDITTTLHKFYCENFDSCLNQLEAALTASNHSLMLSITHERIAGHWVVLDEINSNEKTADIRDPYSGKAYRVSFEELRKNLYAKDHFGYETQHYLQISSLPKLCHRENPVSFPRPQTPPRAKRHYTPTPETPRVKQRRIEARSVFKTQLPVTKKSIYTNLFDGGYGLRIDGYKDTYETQSGQIYPLIQQPTNSKSCGAGALMMLVLGYLQKLNPQTAFESANRCVGENNVSFWEWYSRGGLTNGEEIQSCLMSFFNIPTIFGRLKNLDIDADFEFIKKALDDSGHSVMVGINHKHLGFHWIIVDEISSTAIDVRDPYSGKAYRLSHDELKQTLDVGDYLIINTNDENLKKSLAFSFPRLNDGEVAPDTEGFWAHA